MVKEKVFGGLTIVWLFHPDDIKTLFENEGKYPSRRSHLALEKYRKEKPEFYNNGGLLPTNGYEWARMRKAAQKPLTKQLLSNHIQVIIYLLGSIHKRRRKLGGVEGSIIGQTCRQIVLKGVLEILKKWQHSLWMVPCMT